MLKARTKLACQIARIDPDRFNEAVHMGRYPCAPETRPGSARVFGVDDIVALTIYADQLASGLGGESAGAMACRALEIFKDNPEVVTVYRLVGEVGKTHWTTAAFNPAESYWSGIGQVSSWSGFNISALRSRVVAAIAAAKGDASAA
jgi:hypothetical protein